MAKHIFVTNAPIPASHVPDAGYLTARAGQTLVLSPKAAEYVTSSAYPYKNYLFPVGVEAEENDLEISQEEPKGKSRKVSAPKAVEDAPEAPLPQA